MGSSGQLLDFNPTRTKPRLNSSRLFGWLGSRRTSRGGAPKQSIREVYPDELVQSQITIQLYKAEVELPIDLLFFSGDGSHNFQVVGVSPCGGVLRIAHEDSPTLNNPDVSLLDSTLFVKPKGRHPFFHIFSRLTPDAADPRKSSSSWHGFAWLFRDFLRMLFAAGVAWFLLVSRGEKRVRLCSCCALAWDARGASRSTTLRC